MTSKDNGRSMGYRVFSVVVLLILALLFLFPLYWIITGALKTPAAKIGRASCRERVFDIV